MSDSTPYNAEEIKDWRKHARTWHGVVAARWLATLDEARSSAAIVIEESINDRVHAAEAERDDARAEVETLRGLLRNARDTLVAVTDAGHNLRNHIDAALEGVSDDNRD